MRFKTNSPPTKFTFALVAGLTLFLGACQSGGSPGKTRGQGSYKVGQPYQINGKWYHPKEDYSYNRTGVASWYGPGFSGKKTANGEIFDQNALTAAHPTLPMPSLARVTNLENGKTVTVRINDRGPFASTRLIDLSKGAATQLGFAGKGTTTVRVKILASESRAMKEQALRGGSPSAPVVSVSSPQPAPVVSSGSGRIASSTSGAVFDVKEVSYVQVGAFSNAVSASTLRGKVSSFGNTLVSEGHFGDHTIYRVRLGPFTTASEATRVLGKVQHAGYADARIVTD